MIRSSLLIALAFPMLAAATPQEHVTCVALAESAKALSASVEKLCITQYTVAGIPVGTIDLTFYGPEKNPVTGALTDKRIAYGKLSYRRIYAFEPEGRLSLVLTDRGNPLSFAFENLHVALLRYTTDAATGRQEGTLRLGPTELKGRQFFWRTP